MNKLHWMNERCTPLGDENHLWLRHRKFSELGWEMGFTDVVLRACARGSPGEDCMLSALTSLPRMHTHGFCLPRLSYYLLVFVNLRVPAPLTKLVHRHSAFYKGSSYR
jgi:hypothetical protein